MIARIVLLQLLAIVSFVAAQPAGSARDSWWWDEQWWTRGQLAGVVNFPVETRTLSYRNGDVEVPVKVIRPRDGKKTSRRVVRARAPRPG